MDMVQILTTWKDYATVKTWKKGLKYDSHNNRLSEDTEKAIHLYMPLFLEYKQKNPDDIIEEALAGKSVVKETLSDFCTWLEDEKNKSFNHAVHITHHVIRGFYSHNNINTQKISIPTLDPSSVQTTDDNFSVFDIVEVEDVDGKKDKVMKIKRELLCKFLDLLSFRNKVFITCIKDTGADSEILENGHWTISDIKMAGIDHTPYQLFGLSAIEYPFIVAFGDNWFSWRFPVIIFGMVFLYFNYKVIQHIKDKKTALLVTGILAFSPLVFVQSALLLRDIPVMALGFMAVYLYLKQKYYFSALVLGLSALIKETAIFFVAFIILHYVMTNRKKLLLGFLSMKTTKTPIIVPYKGKIPLTEMIL